MSDAVNGLSMRSSWSNAPRKSQSHRFSLRWKVYRDASGQIMFRKIAEPVKILPESDKSVLASMPRRLLDDKSKTADMFRSVENAGGKVLRSSNRLVLISVEANSLEEVGEALDSFGCQWTEEEES